MPSQPAARPLGRGTIPAVRVHFSNLGCKLNQAELEQLAREFTSAGHRVVRSLEEADLHVVNTCTVTHVAARDSRKRARRGARVNPSVRTVLTGCYVASDPEEAAALAGVDLIVPNESKHELLAHVQRTFPEWRRVPAPSGVPCAPSGFGNTRALVKIEDGCDMTCAFCIIPSTRGSQRSRRVNEVVAEIAELVDGGFREIVITGVQISSYRRDGLRLYDLVERALAETAVPRLRLTSIAPWQFDRRLLDLFDPTRAARTCRHFHLSLQSGSTATLRRMRRPYDAEGFAALVDEIRAAVPGVAITTDVIVGFPGETDEEFAESLRFVERIGFCRVHAFPYSERPGTEAAALPDAVPHDVKRERMRQMLEAAERAERSFYECHVGHDAEVLWEQRKDDGRWWGTSDNYLRVVAESSRDLTQRLERARLGTLSDGGPIAALAASTESTPGVAATGAA